MSRQVIHHDDVSRAQSWRQLLLHPSQEDGPVDGTVNDQRGEESVRAQRAEKGRGLPVAVRHVFDEALAHRAPTVEPRHIGFDPGFVEEDESVWIDAEFLNRLKFPSLSYDIGPLLFRCDLCFFLKEIFKFTRAW